MDTFEKILCDAKRSRDEAKDFVEHVNAGLGESSTPHDA